VGQIEAMDAALARLKEKSPNKPLLEALETYAAPLRASGAVLKKCGDLKALAIQKIEGGILLKDWAVVGGVGHEVYSNNCEPKRATWIYGKKTKTNKMAASFALDRAPETGVLVIEGQDTDKEGVTKVEIVLNGRSLYKGPNKCRKQGWTEWRIEAPQGVLKNGQNTLMIRNLEDTDSVNAAWFMVSQAKVMWK